MMTVHPEQDDPNCKHSCMSCRACIQISLDVYVIYAIIDTKILKTPNDIFPQLVDLDDGRKPDIGTLKKYRGDIFS